MTSCKRDDFRSGLEFRVAQQLEEQGYTYEYEKTKVKYQRKISTYTPDFELHNGIIIEGKGKFVGSDRSKHLLIKEQHPELDIRFDKQVLTSVTTYKPTLSLNDDTVVHLKVN